MRIVDATEIADKIFNEVISRYGCPETLSASEKFGQLTLSNIAKHLKQTHRVNDLRTRIHEATHTVKRITTIYKENLEAIHREGKCWSKFFAPMLMAERSQANN